MATVATDATVLRAALIRRIGTLVEMRVARRREAIGQALVAAGVGDVVVQGDMVQGSGRGLRARWMRDLALRDAGRGEA